MQGSPLSSNAIQKRVLVADDDPFYREMASSSLSAAGYTVITAVDGAEGLQFLGPDAVRRCDRRHHHAEYGWL